MANRIRLGELLVRAGVIDEMQLKAALAEQHRWGGRLGRVLVDMAFVSEEILVKALSKQLGVERADFSKFDVPGAILDRIPLDFAQTNSLCPVRYDEGRRALVVATADPTNVAALDELRFKTGLRIETVLAGEHEIHDVIHRRLRAAHGIPFDEPEAIELSEDDGRSVIVGNDDYASAMAASGLPVVSGRPGAGVATPDDRPARGRAEAPPNILTGQALAPPGAPPPESGPAGRFPPTSPSGGFSTGLPGASAPSVGPVGPTAAPSPAPTPSGPVPETGSALDMATRLEGAQRQQQRALRVMVELLIEKGVISRDEYIARVHPKR